jgi:rubrerythrin
LETGCSAAAGADSGEQDALAQLVDDPSSRKRFLRMVGGAGAAGAFATHRGRVRREGDADRGHPARPGTVAEFGPGDVGIVSYALTLEYLEEDFYDQIRKSGEVTDGPLKKLIDKVYKNEFDHARALERVAEQMGRPVKRPEVDFDSVLEGGQRKILKESAKIENLGASAYLGQAPRIVDRQVLASALAIHTVEARHAAAFNEMAGNGFSGDDQLIGTVPDGAFAKPMTMKEVLKEAKKFLPKGLPMLESPTAS